MANDGEYRKNVSLSQFLWRSHELMFWSSKSKSED